MKKILFLIPNLSEGGAEKVLINLVNSLDSRKYNITVYSLFDTGSNKSKLNKRINYKYYFKKQFRGNIHILKLFTPRYLYKKIIGETYYDYVISYLEGPTTRIISGGDNPKIKKINWIHTDVSINKLSFKAYRSKTEMKSCFSNFDKTVFVSNVAKYEFLKLNIVNKSSTKTLYNLIDSEDILKKANENISDDYKIDYKKINFIALGRLTRVKGFERLINIFSEVVKKHKNVHLYIIGKGELELKILKKIKELRLEDFISLLGYKENPYPYIKKANYVVCSSYTEGYSSVVAEAVILGKKVLTTDCSGMKEILNEKSLGKIVENSDQGIYYGLLDIIENFTIKININEKEKFSSEKYMKENLKEFESFLNEIL